MKLPSYKEIVDLIKTGATIDAQERIMELRQMALGWQEETLRLRDRVAELESRIRELERGTGERCPRCNKPTWSVINSESDALFGKLGGIRRTYRCSECGLTEARLVQ